MDSDGMQSILDGSKQNIEKSKVQGNATMKN